MPKFDADKAFYEPIEVVINGKTYKIEKVSQDLFDRIKEVSKEQGDEKDASIIFRQLGVALEEDPEVFKGMDLRVAGAVLRFLTESITAQVEGKNA